ncbi:MAG: ABC transporter permease [Actinomycetota bacterium]|nr:ABC transporter permease [Actinomycetota bacterium]
MRFWEIGKRNLKEIYRDPVLLAFLLGMPIAFMVVFCFAFGGEHASPTRISVVDEDQSRTSSAFLHSLESAETLEISKPIYTDEVEARQDLEHGKISFYLIVPPGLEKAKQAQMPVNLEIAYEEADPMIGQMVKPTIEAVTSKFLGVPLPVNIKLRGMEVKIKNEVVNFLAPGIVVFGLMILISTGAERVAADREKGILNRMLTTPARPRDFILGYSLPFIPVLIASTLIYLGVGMALGLSIVGNFWFVFLVFFSSDFAQLG